MSTDPNTTETNANQDEQRRCSTTVVMTNNITKPTMDDKDNTTTSGSIRRNGSIRRRLSKQNATLEDPHPDTEETVRQEPKPRSQRLQREDAVVGDDDTKLRPPKLPASSWSSGKSLSRESSENSDRCGINLREFITHTLHKSLEDRNILLGFEQELVQLIKDECLQSKKFEPVNSYHRMLLHRCAAYFGLDHNVTNSGTEVVVNKSDRTILPIESFSDFILHDNYREQPGYRANKISSRGSKYGSNASLDPETLRQSFETMLHPQYQTATPVYPPPQALSPPRANIYQHRSFDSHDAHSKCSSLKRAESFGGMMSPQQPLSVMVQPYSLHHHHHHHWNGMSTPPVLVQDHSPHYYEPQYVLVPNQPIMYTPPVYEQPCAPVHCAPVPVVYQPPMNQQYPTEYAQQYYRNERQKPFPVVEKFEANREEMIKGQKYSSAHQAEVANQFIKASIDGGYGSMNHENGENVKLSTDESSE